MAEAAAVEEDEVLFIKDYVIASGNFEDPIPDDIGTAMANLRISEICRIVRRKNWTRKSFLLAVELLVRAITFNQAQRFPFKTVVRLLEETMSVWLADISSSAPRVRTADLIPLVERTIEWQKTLVEDVAAASEEDDADPDEEPFTTEYDFLATAAKSLAPQSLITVVSSCLHWLSTQVAKTIAIDAQFNLHETILAFATLVNVHVETHMWDTIEMPKPMAVPVAAGVVRTLIKLLTTEHIRPETMRFVTATAIMLLSEPSLAKNRQISILATSLGTFLGHDNLSPPEYISGVRALVYRAQLTARSTADFVANEMTTRQLLAVVQGAVAHAPADCLRLVVRYLERHCEDYALISVLYIVVDNLRPRDTHDALLKSEGFWSLVDCIFNEKIAFLNEHTLAAGMLARLIARDDVGVCRRIEEEEIHWAQLLALTTIGHPSSTMAAMATLDLLNDVIAVSLSSLDAYAEIDGEGVARTFSRARTLTASGNPTLDVIAISRIYQTSIQQSCLKSVRDVLRLRPDLIQTNFANDIAFARATPSEEARELAFADMWMQTAAVPEWPEMIGEKLLRKLVRLCREQLVRPLFHEYQRKKLRIAARALLDCVARYDSYPPQLLARRVPISTVGT